MAKKQSKAARKSAQETPQAPQVAQPSQGPKPASHRPAARSSAATPKKLPLGDNALFTILGVLLLLLLALQGGASDRVVGVGMGVVFVACSIGRGAFANLKERLSIPVLAVFAYVALNAAAGLYARFGTFASTEFGKIFAAFSAFAIVLFRLRREHLRPFAAMVSAVTGVFALLSIDASSLNLLSRGYVAVMDTLGCDYAGMTIGYEAGVRITGLFGNPNVLGGMLALGVFLALAVTYGAKTDRARLGGCLLLGVNALGFLLAFSMGAIAMFAVSVVIYLVAAAKADRLPLLVLMVETAVIVLLMTALSFPGLGAAGALAAVPVLAGPVGGVLLWAAHRFVGVRLSGALNAHGRAAAIAICAVVIVAAGYVVAGYNLTGSYSFDGGETLRRSVYPAPGTYMFSAGGAPEAFSVTVESQNDSQTIMHTSTVLYEGPLAAGASFTVPEDAKVVYVNLTAQSAATLDHLSFTDGPKVPLGYKLLPGFVANRIQGLWANQNAIQRTAFYRDGMRIFAMSPAVGSGLGAVEGLVTGVQDFFYESRYVHNHYVQVLAEMGVLGLVLFVGMLGTTAVTLVRRRRETGGAEDALLPALCACLGMMALHGGVEAIWSVSVFQTVALLLLAGMAVCYARPLAKLKNTGAAVVANGALWLFALTFAWLLYGNISAEATYWEVKSGLREQTPYTMSRLAKQDKYNWAQYELDMAVNAVGSEVPEFRDLAAQYAQRLRKLKTCSINLSLATYYYPTLGNWDEFFAATREGIVQDASRSENWQSTLDLYEAFYPGDEAENAQWYAAQCLQLCQMLLDYNDGRMEQIGLTEQNAIFISHMQEIAG